MRSSPTTPASHVRSRSSTSGPTRSRSSATDTASSSSMLARSSLAPTIGGRRGSSSSSEVAVTDARELAELISAADAVPASGWVAGVSASFAAALVVKAATRSDGWSDSAGARAQAVDLRDRLLALAAQDAKAYEAALDAL